ncbi:MAG: alpha/beta hydrolase [Chloroflexi bacterium]|nr:alpha/beta hydrolase [Chloroflexota bacterium]
MGIARGALRIACLTLLGLALGGLALLLFEERFIYLPSRELVGSPADVGLSYEDVTFSASDGVALHGWYVPGPAPVTLVWFHGNAGNISHRLGNLRGLHDLVGVSVLLFDYRGYGRSAGSPSEEGTYHDAEGAVAFLAGRTGQPAEHLVYFGRSLGAAVALEMALRRPPAALIIESPFLSIPHMAREVYPFLPALGGLLRTRYDSLGKIPRLTAPVLVVVGEADDVVSPNQGRLLFERAPEPKRWHSVPGAGHNDTPLVGGAAYYGALRTFLAEFSRLD